MRLSSSPSALLLALPLLGHVACGGTVAATTQGTGGSSSSTTTTGTTSTTTGTGGADACGATADSLSLSLTTYDGKKFPAAPGAPGPALVIEGKVTQYDSSARIIEVDSCGPVDDCVPTLSKFEILGAKGSFYPSIAPGSFLRIEAVGDLSGWMIQIKSLATWQGQQNPAGPAENLVFAAFMGESNGTTGMVPEFPSPIADAPFQVSLAALPCGPVSGGPTPGYQPFMLRFTGPTLKSPVDVHMGEGGVASATSDGQYWQFENLQSSELPAGTPPDGPDQYWVTYFIHSTLPGE